MPPIGLWMHNKINLQLCTVEHLYLAEIPSVILDIFLSSCLINPLTCWTLYTGPIMCLHFGIPSGRSALEILLGTSFMVLEPPPPPPLTPPLIEPLKKNPPSSPLSKNEFELQRLYVPCNDPSRDTSILNH